MVGLFRFLAFDIGGEDDRKRLKGCSILSSNSRQPFPLREYPEVLTKV